MIFDSCPLELEHGIKTLAACGGIRGVDGTFSFYRYFNFLNRTLTETYIYRDKQLSLIPLLGR
jgi:hypothetical protein